MTEYVLTPTQKENFLLDIGSNYSFVDDGVSRDGVVRYSIRGPSGQSGVLMGFPQGDNLPARYIVITNDPIIDQYMSRQRIPPQRGGIESFLTKHTGFHLSNDQMRMLMERLGPEYSQVSDGRGGSYIVSAKSDGERRVRGSEALRNGGLGAAASIRQEVRDFRPNVTIGYVLNTNDPRILSELQAMGIQNDQEKRTVTRR